MVALGEFVFRSESSPHRLLGCAGFSRNRNRTPPPPRDVLRGACVLSLLAGWGADAEITATWICPGGPIAFVLSGGDLELGVAASRAVSGVQVFEFAGENSWDGWGFFDIDRGS